ncbi:hypothetical protein I3842_08G169800 [Carya illinoinensis]|uniref:Stress regulated protein n=1 Tax=Carya illinoinensis TaxID=32201 RepID=A0A922EDC0_CARIL|nr:hypothetical protein I3842_08G169800 [Carya illinoinensis]
MGTMAYHAGLSCRPQLRLTTFGIICSSQVGVSRRQALEQLDKKLAEDDDRAALSLAKDLQGKPGGLRCFGGARQVSFDGGVGSLVLDTIGHTFSQKYHNRVIQHEAGHFLIAYLVGILPKGYTLTSLEALKKEGSLNVQAGTAFVDFEFVEETLNRFSCIALAGVAAEYILYGVAEGGLADINKLDMLLKSLAFTQKKADSQVRWSVLNTVLLLRRHELARAKLAEAMSMGKSVGNCIGIIEETIDDSDIQLQLG